MPITALYTALAALLLVGLSWRVVQARQKSHVSIGDGGDAELTRRIRAQGNTQEYLPLGLLVVLMLELNHAPVWAVHLAGATLILGRLLHAWGLSRSSGVSFGRFTGTVLTWLVLLAGALGLLWLVLL